MVGHVTGETKRDLIARALVTVVPSECYEGFGLTAAESLALGTPVIASRIGGLPDLVDNGHTGLLFAPGNPAELAACMQNLGAGQEFAHELAMNGLVKARHEFSPRRHLGQLLHIYRDAVSSKQ